ncbi:MAG TPA: LacI family DNA-binding transcriptional regulator [Acidimicrobiales bacterium]|nr:LacI family DNA-binding transcriptional regulator [Acidimicrobiales bacterium]
MAEPIARVTLADVAAAAGVNPATVSRALTRPDLVAEATRTRVLAEADRLGYVPDRAARSLARGRTGAIGIVVPDITNPFFAAVVRAAQGAAADADHLLLLGDSRQDPAEETRLVAALAPQVDALVLCAPVGSPAPAPTPLVLVNSVRRGIPSVVVDQRAVVDLAVDHLRDLGHRRIALVRGPVGYWSSRQRDGRAASGDLMALGPVTPDHAGGVQAADLARGVRATAVVAFNDLVALGVLARLHELGVSVPGKMSVVGADDVAVAAMAAPSLTTVAAPVDDLGRCAVATALALVRGETVRAQVVLEPWLVVRGSTAPLRRARAR